MQAQAMGILNKVRNQGGEVEERPKLYVNGKEYEIYDKIGGESKYTVYKASHGGKFFAVKVISTEDQESNKKLLSEIEILKELADCPSSITYVDSSVTTKYGGTYEGMIVTDFCNGGSLPDLMNHSGSLREEQITKIMLEVCLAISRLHYKSPPVIHMVRKIKDYLLMNPVVLIYLIKDIKVDNVLLSEYGNAMLCDYGSIIRPFAITDVSKILYYQEEMERITTAEYRAPELCDLFAWRRVDEKADIWALGVLLFKMCFFSSPFPDANKLAILNAKYSIPKSHPYSPVLIYIIENCLKSTPSERLTIYDIVNKLSELCRIKCPIPNIYGNIPKNPIVAIPQEMVGERKQETKPSLEPTVYGASIFDQNRVISPMRRGRPTKSNNSGGETVSTEKVPNFPGNFGQGLTTSNNQTVQKNPGNKNLLDFEGGQDLFSLNNSASAEQVPVGNVGLSKSISNTTSKQDLFLQTHSPRGQQLVSSDKHQQPPVGNVPPMPHKPNQDILNLYHTSNTNYGYAQPSMPPTGFPQSGSVSSFHQQSIRPQPNLPHSFSYDSNNRNKISNPPPFAPRPNSSQNSGIPPFTSGTFWNK